ncbi:threonine/serine exporter family protein [Lysinibacter sp. HNR]|uniref:threonine/serine ThrE exporter family protein n=1 Tax=Lysinibacter sp. HNR TaxID=3031408 RepID=UPI002435BF74|nr:threonine/serine exporter family protein [Lysinibacter sp. HNR]WGD38556.1 threonine/serine exporter family protein [Lysinibacter sp. HNR]
MVSSPPVQDRPNLREFLLGLAEAMTAANESVDEINEYLTTISRAYNAPDTDFVVLPTVILVQTGGVVQGKVAIRSRTRTTFRFDQIAELYTLIHRAERGAIDPIEGIKRLNHIGAMKPQFDWVTRTLGHAILTTGLAFLLVPTPEGIILAFFLGLGVGLAKLIRSPTLQLAFPTFAAFACAFVVFILAEHLDIGDPLRLLIVPLATFLPGGALTTATVELASGQMISGAARLVTGVVQLGLLAFGILAAGTVLGMEASKYTVPDSAPALPWWAQVIGLLLFSIGIFLHFSSPTATFGWVLITLLVTFTAQFLGSLVAGPTLSGFIGAAVMTPVVLLIATFPRGAPSQITFLPAFWLLVPGASSLIELTGATGTEAGFYGFLSALALVLSIALGILIGTAIFRTIRSGAEEITTFTVEIPQVEVPTGSSTVWSRLVSRMPRFFLGREAPNEKQDSDTRPINATTSTQKYRGRNTKNREIALSQEAEDSRRSQGTAERADRSSPHAG